MFGISNKIVTRISLFVTLFVKYPIYHSSISFSYQTQDAKGRYNKLIISDVLFLSSNSIFPKRRNSAEIWKIEWLDYASSYCAHRFTPVFFTLPVSINSLMIVSSFL